MSKAVLMTMNPKQCELVASGEATTCVRKSMPKIEVPFKVYIYCTNGYIEPDSLLFANSGKGKVIGEFMCDRILPDDIYMLSMFEEMYESITGMTHRELVKYGDGKRLFLWDISNLVIYNKPKELSDFSSGSSRLTFSDTEDGFPWIWSGMKRPPRSWCYVEELD